MNRLILFLIRLKFGLKKGELFRFTNQKKDDIYFINELGLFKRYTSTRYGQRTVKSNASLNWLLDKECKIEKVPVAEQVLDAVKQLNNIEKEITKHVHSET